MIRKAEQRWKIPDDWTWATLSDVGDIVGGGTPSTMEPSYWADEINWISPSDLTGYSDKTIKRGAKSISRIGLANSSAVVMPAGSVHFSSRAPIGYVVISGKPLATNQGFKSLVPAHGILNEYVYYYLLGSQEYARERANGTTFLELSAKSFAELSIPIAPISTQCRIVAKIEELFSELDKGIESLKTARRQLEVYRQSVLKHAFEGRLTAQWREENKDKLETPEQLLARIKRERAVYGERQFQEWRSAVKIWEGGDRRTDKPKKPPSPKPLSKLDEHLYPGLPQLPESWVWEKLGWMTCGVEYGTAAKSSKSGRVPVLRMGNIQNGTFDWTDLVYTSDNDEIAGYVLHDGDVLFNRTNSPDLVGKTAIYRGERPAIFAGYLIRVNQIPTAVESEYVNFFLNSDVARQYGNNVKTDGVNQSNINGAKLVNYPFPYCSIQEQREIVRILDETISIADDTEAKIHAEIERSVVLRQAILQTAFAGHLVAQDPNDEPASVLLEKIRTGRAKADKSGPTARRNRKAKTAV